MKLATRSLLFVCFGLSMGVTLVVPGSAATLVQHSDEASFVAAAGGGLMTENFDGFPIGTVITNQVSGIIFSSPNEGMPNYFPIQIFADVTTSSPPFGLFGGFVQGQPLPLQIYVLDFLPPTSAFAFQLTAQHPAATDVEVEFEFADATSQSLFIGDSDGNEDTPEFFGATSDTPIKRVTLISGLEGPNAGFEEFSMDDLKYKGAIVQTRSATWGILKSLYR